MAMMNKLLVFQVLGLRVHLRMLYHRSRLTTPPTFATCLLSLVHAGAAYCSVAVTMALEGVVA